MLKVELNEPHYETAKDAFDQVDLFGGPEIDSVRKHVQSSLTWLQGGNKKGWQSGVSFYCRYHTSGADSGIPLELMRWMSEMYGVG